MLLELGIKHRFVHRIKKDVDARDKPGHDVVRDASFH
jgi:hypothetical protein